MNKPETTITDETGTSLKHPRPAEVPLADMKGIIEGIYTQRALSVFTRRFSDKKWRKGVSPSQVNRFLNCTLPPNSEDYPIIKQTLEWLMGVEIISNKSGGE